MHRCLKCIRLTAVVVFGLALLAWGISALLISAFSYGRIYDRASIDELPQRRVAVVLGCSLFVQDGRYNLYFTRRVEAAAELYKAGNVDTIIVSGDNHIKGYDEPTDMKVALSPQESRRIGLFVTTPALGRLIPLCERRRSLDLIRL